LAGENRKKKVEKKAQKNAGSNTIPAQGRNWEKKEENLRAQAEFGCSEKKKEGSRKGHKKQTSTWSRGN